MKKILLLSPLILFPKLASAHCPLCTVGAGALAVAAASIGVATPVVGTFLGAFSMALGLWLAGMVKKQYIKYQYQILTTVIFLSTIIPIMPLIREYRPLYLSWFGEYGTFFHNTYVINLYLLGAAVGAGIMLLSPYLSRTVTRMRGGQTLPYQGLGITFILVVIAAIIFQLTI
jgi:hypothetical protein